MNSKKQTGEAEKTIKDSIKTIENEERKIRKYLPSLLKEYKESPEIWLLTEHISYDEDNGYDSVYELKQGRIFNTYRTNIGELSHKKFVKQLETVSDLIDVAERLFEHKLAEERHKSKKKADKAKAEKDLTFAVSPCFQSAEKMQAHDGNNVDKVIRNSLKKIENEEFAIRIYGEDEKIQEDSRKKILNEKLNIREYLPKQLADEKYKKIPEIWLITTDSHYLNGNDGCNYTYSLRYGKVFRRHGFDEKEMNHDDFVGDFSCMDYLIPIAKRLLSEWR